MTDRSQSLPKFTKDESAYLRTMWMFQSDPPKIEGKQYIKAFQHFSPAVGDVFVKHDLVAAPLVMAVAGIDSVKREFAIRSGLVSLGFVKDGVVRFIPEYITVTTEWICLKLYDGRLLTVRRKCESEFSAKPGEAHICLSEQEEQKTRFEFEIDGKMVTGCNNLMMGPSLTDEGARVAHDLYLAGTADNGSSEATARDESKPEKGLCVKGDECFAYWNGKRLKINQHADFSVLTRLQSTTRKVVSYTDLLRTVKPNDVDKAVKVTEAPQEVRDAVSHINTAFRDVNCPMYIKAVRNQGYQLLPDE